MQITKYFASLGINIDRASVKQVDSVLKGFENRIRTFGKRVGGGLNLSKFSLSQSALEAEILKSLKIASTKLQFELNKFSVNHTALNLVLGSALDVASTRNIFQISRFNVDQSHLNNALIVAMRQASAIAATASPLRPRVALNPAARLAESGLRPRQAAVAGGIAGGLSRLYGPALALGFGGYGLSQLNQRNQQVVSAQLQTSAVVQQAGGTAAQGADSFQYLRSEGQRIGFNYLDASQDYNKLISGLTGSGVGLKESQKVFSGFAELARVNKLDKTTQNRLFRALSQVAGKGKLQSEELTGQIAEALPGGTALFAQAYQAKIGGNKTGSEAIQQLLADMKKGKVTSDILTYAGAAASERANAGGALGTASQASQAEQARYQNQVNDLAVVASNAGVEEGFARIFRTLNGGLSESNGLVRTLSEQFNEATKFADDLLLFPQDFIRALEGRDSLVADWLGVGKTSQLVKDWKDIKMLVEQLSKLNPTNLFGDFLPTLEATTRELAAILNALAEIQRLKQGKLPTENVKPDSLPKIDPFGLGEYTSPAAILGAVGNNTLVSFANAKIRGQAVYEDQSSPFYKNPELFDSNKQFNIDYYRNLSAIQRDPEAQMLGDAIRTAQTEDLLTDKLKDSLSRRPEEYGFDKLNNSNSVEQSLGLYQDNIQTPEDVKSQSRDAAFDQASQSVVNNIVTNEFDITISVDATLAGVEVEQQAQAMASAFSSAITGAFEQVQVNYPKQ